MPETDQPATGVMVRFWWQTEAPCQVVVPKPGDLCEACGKGGLGYNSQFQLACPTCGHIAEAGAFT